MEKDRIAIQICGFGGQGVILASVIFGTAAVTQKGYYAVQTQSFGSETRGGECQAELVLSKNKIYSPIVNKVDILVGMSDAAFRRYLPRLKNNGISLIDADLVKEPARKDIKMYPIPANRIAKELGFSLSANMVFLGALQVITGIISESDLYFGIEQNVSPRVLQINTQAAKKGRDFIKSMERA